MQNNFRRRVPHAAIRSVLLSLLFAAAHAYAQVMQFDIPAQDAATGIPEFARQAGLQIIAPADQLKGIQTHQVLGSMQVREALQRLLEGTGLVVSSDDGHTISLRLPADRARSQTARSENNAAAGETSAVMQLEEVIVTAQKREERLQDVPVPVTVLNADQLADENRVSIRDYFQQVPGLMVAPNVLGQQRLSIRGITTGPSGGPTVGVSIDDVPYGGSTDVTNGGNSPDIDPGDLENVEVLRGPQGTLYGADSMGGLIKYVTKEPSTDGFSGRIAAGTSGVYHGAEPGFEFRGSANIPISSSFAMRASGYTRQSAGYIDNPRFHLEGVNETEAEGARVMGLWRPSDVMSVKLTAFYQRSDLKGGSEVDFAPGLGDLQQNYLPATHTDTSNIQGYSAVIKGKLAGVDIASITGYTKTHLDITDDRSSVYGSTAQTYYQNSNVPLQLLNNNNTFSEELRLSGTITRHLQWLVGGFFTNQRIPLLKEVAYGETASGAYIEPPFYDFHALEPTYFRERAGFGNLTVVFNEQFDVQLGGRGSYDTVFSGSGSNGGFLATGPVQPTISISPSTFTNNHAFTYLVAPRFKVTPDLMVYARLASGFRPGGGNVPGPLSSPGVPDSYGPDKTENYELGIKADYFEHKLSIDASFYHINWKDIQILTINPAGTIEYITNGGNAKSEGVELTVRAKPAAGLTISGWVSYDNAVLTKDFPIGSTVYGASGDRLPQSERFSGNLSGEQSFRLWSDKTGFIGAEASYVGDRLGLFQGVAGDGNPVPRQNLGGYTTIDLRAGVRGGDWDAKLYVLNAADRRGVINGGLGYRPSNAFAIIQPRTIGITVSRAF